MARPPRRDGLPAPGHPPARLRAEGLPLRVQARGLRAFQQHARPGQVRHGVGADADRDPHRCGPAARGRGAPGAADARAADAARRGAVDPRQRRRRGRAGGGRRRAGPRRWRAAAVGAAGGGSGRGRRARRRPRPGSRGGAVRAHGDRKVGRNEPCPCGSGKKFKHCHGTLVDAE
ncbi:MAG: SEC-C metal-binding domain-containing protein [Steroidobacteraceae bacterium]